MSHERASSSSSSFAGLVSSESSSESSSSVSEQRTNSIHKALLLPPKQTSMETSSSPKPPPKPPVHMTSSFVDTVTADDDDIEEDIDERKTSRKQRYFSVFLFTTTSAFLYADQNLLSPNLSQAAEEFNFSDREKDVKLAGWLQLAFFVVGSPASLIIGWMCDKTESRVRLLFLTTLIGEGPCLATYWVTKYWQLFMLRAMTGIAVGGCLPLLFSLCGDLFSHKTRAKVASFLTIATGAGIAFGQIMSGAVGPKYGWKVPFVVSAAPAVFFAFLTWMLVDEPVRGGMDVKVNGNHFGHQNRAASRGVGEESEEGGVAIGGEEKKKKKKQKKSSRKDSSKSSSKRDENEDDIISQLSVSDIEIYSGKMDVQKLKRQLRVKTNVLVFIQGVFGTIPWGVLNAYFVDYLHANRGLTVGQGTAAVTLFGLGGAIGVIGGGVWGQRLYNRNKSSVAVLMGLSTMLGALPSYYFVNSTYFGPSESLLYFSCFVTGILCSLTPPNVRAVLMNINPPETRGSVFACYSQVDDIGKGLGPVFIAGLIVVFNGRQIAFNVAFSMWFICGLFLLMMKGTIEKDAETASRQMEAEIVRSPARERTQNEEDNNV
ncbi:major facilitator superfamily [Bathycoccus prasinos]|jgi:MFS family permease|uniref:Major facilitator superfamily n=1 Tax=Bathycoccus prasinos TaxID=41875 RepID=K8F0Z3_9CHLO|nr:major facilitator superfamily [Bathycoccus prasinos]CCO15223.1 major facilitator superfamily [Bathycoccus prasinos]|eukprot:XP_007514983.1 major facilitator superfamily [Bathycoccus prasinos]